jgi:cytochrome b561
MKGGLRGQPPAGGGRHAWGVILLHWLIAAAVVVQVMLAWRMEARGSGGAVTPEIFNVSQLHKSIGITILLLTVMRLAWRLANPPPPLPLALIPWERSLARITHVGFYVALIAMPLTGWLMLSTGRFNLPTMLYGVARWPDLPVLPQLPPPAKRMWHEVFKSAHVAFALALLGLLGLHVAGVLKHQLRRDEPVLARMAPGAQPGRWLEPRLLLILLAAVGLIVFGKLFKPPPMGPEPRLAPAAPATSSPVLRIKS